MSVASLRNLAVMGLVLAISGSLVVDGAAQTAAVDSLVSEATWWQGSGDGRWGYVPALADSVQGDFGDVKEPVWYRLIELPWLVIALPLGWLNDRVGDGIYWFLATPTGRWIKEALRPKDVPYGLTVAPQLGGLTRVEVQFTLYHNQFFDPNNKARVSYKLGTQNNRKLFFGVDALSRIDYGAGWRVRGNARYFGIGPDAPESNESFYTEELSWFGLGVGSPLSETVTLSLRASVNSLTSRGPTAEEGPSIEDEFAGDLPAGFGVRSWGPQFGILFEHDSTNNRGRPSSGMIQRARIDYQGIMEGSGDYATLRGETQHFFKLWKTQRTLALRGFMAWTHQASDEPINFTRLYFNDDPDLLRGYKDYRWRDQGMLAVNAEYRWPAWVLNSPTGTGVDAYLLADVGQVYGDLSEISMDNMTFSGGFGFRVVTADKLFTRLEFAWSDTEFVARLRSDQIFQYLKSTLFYGRRPMPAR